MKHQKERLAEFFKQRPDTWIALPEILQLGIAQYNSRLLDCRRDGMDIKNKIEIVEGIKHSWYMYEQVKVEASGQLAMVI